jgi:hypothetical protein
VGDELQGSGPKWAAPSDGSRCQMGQWQAHLRSGSEAPGQDRWHQEMGALTRMSPGHPVEPPARRQHLSKDTAAGETNHDLAWLPPRPLSPGRLPSLCHRVPGTQVATPYSTKRWAQPSPCLTAPRDWPQWHHWGALKQGAWQGTWWERGGTAHTARSTRQLRWGMGTQRLGGTSGS